MSDIEHALLMSESDAGEIEAAGLRERARIEAEFAEALLSMRPGSIIWVPAGPTTNRWLP